MFRLRTGDLEGVLSFVAEAQAHDGPEPFTPGLLDELAGLVGCEFATYFRVDLTSRVQHAYVPCSYEVASYGASADDGEPPLEGVLSDEEWENIAAGGDCMMCMRHPTGVGKWSDIYTYEARREYEGPPEWANFFEVVDCVGTLVGAARDRWSLCLHSQERDFTERDRSVVVALVPHVAALVRHAASRRRASSLLATVETENDDGRHGLLLLGHRYEIEYTSPAARRLMHTWFGDVGTHVTDLLEDWLASATRPEPLRIDGNGRRLVVEAPASGALILTEESAPAASLTPREVEVLTWIAVGKSNAETARLLWITPATVSKHLEQIYRKLGVTSRTAALAAVGLTRSAGG